MWPLILTIYLWLQYYWISKKPLTLLGNLACYVDYLNWNFWPVWSSLLALFSRKENSEFRSTMKCLRQGKCKQECLKVLSCPQQYVHKWYSPNTKCLSGSLCQWHLYVYHELQRGLCSQHQCSSYSIETLCKGCNIKMMTLKLEQSTPFIDLDHLTSILHECTQHPLYESCKIHTSSIRGLHGDCI